MAPSNIPGHFVGHFRTFPSQGGGGGAFVKTGQPVSGALSKQIMFLKVVHDMFFVLNFLVTSNTVFWYKIIKAELINVVWVDSAHFLSSSGVHV